MLQSTPPLPSEVPLVAPKPTFFEGPTGCCVGEGVKPLPFLNGLPVPIGEGKCTGFGETLEGSARPGGSSGRYEGTDGGRFVDNGGVASRILERPRGVCIPNSFLG